ncbi:hypothetical protein [Nocardia callitridis]|uniref:hypothetical protein n=1 Tax=Nocardia callitridis TaxID=648753 RepID=UPI003CD0C3AF
MMYNVLIFFRWGGVIVITIGCMGVFIGEAVKSRLSPVKIIVVGSSGVLAVMVFWSLPNLANIGRSDSTIIVPDQPIGSYR